LPNAPHRRGTCRVFTHSAPGLRCLAWGFTFLPEPRGKTMIQISEQHYRCVVESARDAILWTDPDGAILSWNQGAASMFSYTAEDMVGRPLTDLLPERFRDPAVPGLARFDGSGYGRFRGTMELIGRRKDASEFWIELAFSEWTSDAGTFLSAVIRDITERKRVEEELRSANAQLSERRRALEEALQKLNTAHQDLQQTQLQFIQVAKMESVGRLAAGVAHEVKNPLATLLMGLDVLTDHYPIYDADLAILLRDMKSAVKRADAVIKGLLDFSAPRQLEKTEQSINALVEQGLTLIKHELKLRHVSVEKHLDGAIPSLNVDRTKLEQVFVNIFMNAVQAMQEGGSIRVETSASAGQILIRIDDTGPGVPPDKLSKVFDPFFTTKPTGQGTGLGLTVSKQIVEMHGGTITIANKPSGGARVQLAFSIGKGVAHGH